MGIYSGVEWPKCPHCGCTINTWDHIPAQAIFGDKRFGFEITCPGAYGKTCGKSFWAYAEAKIIFRTEKRDEDE